MIMFTDEQIGEMESESVEEAVKKSERQELEKCFLFSSINYICREKKDDCERINNSFGLKILRRGY